MDAGLKRELEAKINAGERLSRDDGIALYASDDLAWLGRLAHHQRTKLNGDRVLFTANPAADAASASMSYAHDAEPATVIDQLVGLREVQDDSGGFATFIPLRADEEAAPAESLKIFAVSRLMFDNVPHVQASWATHGRSVAQLALNFGADEVGGTDDQTTEDLLEFIWDAGLRPVRRNSRYEVEQEYDPAPRLADRRSEPQQVWA